jgi:hypothetical protein
MRATRDHRARASRRRRSWQILRAAFCAEVFTRCTARLLTAVPARDAADLAPLAARIPALGGVDGARLAAIAHRLTLLWAAILPGCLLAVYDVTRGRCRTLAFAAEKPMKGCGDSGGGPTCRN